MFDPDPYRPPQLVGEVLSTGRLPENIVEALSLRFRIVQEDEIPLSTEKRSGRGIHSLLSHLASGVDLVLGFEWLALLRFDQGVMVPPLHSLLSVTAGLYSTARRLFACLGDLPYYGLPTVVDLPVEAFAARRSMRAVPQEDHVSHPEGVTPPFFNPCLARGR